MRDVKFRAWDTVNKRWANQHEECYLCDDGVIVAMREHGAEGHTFLRKLHGIIISLYTGVKDRNGKEIYEGDILKRGKEKSPTFLAVIEFKSGSFGGATIPYRNYWIQLYNLGSCDHDGDGYDEIIGNIHENPELLTK